MLDWLIELGKLLLSLLQQTNTLLTSNFGGILLVIAAVAALAALREASKVAENQQAMQRLADAIIKAQNREGRESR